MPVYKKRARAPSTEEVPFTTVARKHVEETLPDELEMKLLKRKRKKQRKSPAEPHSDLTQASSSRYVGRCVDLSDSLRRTCSLDPSATSPHETVDPCIHVEYLAGKSIVAVRDDLAQAVAEKAPSKASTLAKDLPKELQTALEDLEIEREKHRESISKHKRSIQHHIERAVQVEDEARTWKEEVQTSRQSLEHERKARIQEVLHIKQDRLLESLQHKEALDKAVTAEKRWQNSQQRAMGALEDEITKRQESSVKHAMEIEKSVLRAVQAERETKIWREEVEHATIVKRTLEEDLEELKTVANEEAAQARESRTLRQLPPAYGTLDDEAQLPPYEVHAKDSKS